MDATTKILDSRAARVGCYLHSDASSPGKGGAMVRVRTTTDFAARGEGVGAFAKKAAMLAYACKAADWSGLAEAWPEMEDARNDLARGLGEGVEIDAICWL